MDVLTELMLYFPRLRNSPDTIVPRLELSRNEMCTFALMLFRKNDIDIQSVPMSPQGAKVQIEDVIAWIEFSLL